jgi:hypothetical protein
VPCLWVPSMQGIQQAIQTSLKPLKHSPAVKLFTRVPWGFGALFTPESALWPQKKVRASGIFRGKGRCVDGSSQVPGMVHAGSAAKRMCLREFSQAIDNTQPGKFPPGKGPVRGGGVNLVKAATTISRSYPCIFVAVF